MTDAHVHFRDWNQSNKETILHGMLTGAKAGFDVFFDMPNCNPPLTDRETIEARIRKGIEAEQALCEQDFIVHYHTYAGVTADKAQLREVIKAYNDLFPRVCGLKMFASQSTGNMGIIEEEQQKAIYRTLAEENYRGVIAVHCEKESLFKAQETAHSRKRPAASEEQSVKDQIRFAEEAGFKGTLHIAHISTKGALDAVREARKRDIIKITCGATPHHILLNDTKETDIVKMNPPLRSEEDRESIWNALFDGTIDWVESDHAPHTLEDKQNGASGLPGFEGMLLTIRKLREAEMPEERLNGLFCTNALKTFGIKEQSSQIPQITEQMIRDAHNAYPFSAWTF